MGLPRVLVLGGGFGGLRCVRSLKNAPVKVTLIDQANHHLFQPLLYQVASSALTPRDIAFPLREVLKRQANATVIMDEATSIDASARSVSFASGRVIEYDYLVVAVGTRHSYFGHDEWEEHAPGLKSLGDALTIKNKILNAFEKAEATDSREEADRLLSFVVVGGGPTGVELAGAIAEIAHKTMLQNFRCVDPRNTKVYLIEGGDRLLPSFPDKLSANAEMELEKLGVRVLKDARVIDIDQTGVTFSSDKVKAKSVFWAAGNQAPSFLQSLNAELDKQGCVTVSSDLSLPNHSNVFVIGDAAHFRDENGQPLPAIAPVAVQQGEFVAKKIQNKVGNQSFKYVDRGAMATIGKAKAVAVIGGRCFHGFLAWILWSLVHIVFLIGFRNRLVVMLEWLFWYVTEKRSSRIIYTTHSDLTDKDS